MLHNASTPVTDTPAAPAPAPVAVAGSRRSRVSALIFMGIALVAGVGAAYLISGYVARHAAGDARSVAAATKKIVVARVDVPLATALDAERVEMAEWPSAALPKGSFDSLAAVQGRVTRTALVGGEPVTEARLAPVGSGQGMAAMIPASMRAMTVRVNEVIGVSGFIHPDDRVDVIAAMRAPAKDRTAEELHAKIVLQAIRVLAVGEEMVTYNAKPMKVPAVTLLVSPAEAERLALSSVSGELRLILRTQSDVAEIDTEGTTPRELLGLVEEPQPSRRHGRREPLVKTEVVAPPMAEVVEVLRGDRPLEERRIRPKGVKP